MTASAQLTAPSLEQLAPHVTSRVRDGDLKTAQLALLGVGIVLIGAAWAFGGQGFFGSYLVGYMGVIGICLGALFFTLIQHVTRAGWGISLRRLAENIAWTLPFMLLLFVPILIGFGHPLYEHWAGPQVDLAKDHVLAGKSVWLNKPFFFARVGVYFLVWITIAWYFRRNSMRQDETGDPAISLHLSRVAAPSLLLFALTITFAAFDWIMSLDPHWFSTIFGVAYFAGGYMGFFAFIILMAKWLGARGYLREAINVEHYHDLAKLMFVFMVFWTYTNFSQYMLIWYANLPEETRWFAVRRENGWLAVGIILILGHFFIPFAFLMSRHVKRNGKALVAAAIFMLVIHNIDMQFLVLPSVGHAEHAGGAHGTGEPGAGIAEAVADGFRTFPHDFGVYWHNIHWTDFGCFVGLLAIVAGLTLLNVRRSNLVPLRDPRLAESLHFQNH